MGLPDQIPLRAELIARASETGRWPHIDLGACAQVSAGGQAVAGANGWLKKVSWPGFSADHTQALVYVCSFSGRRFRACEYIALSRSESGWLIAQTYLESIT